MLEQGGGGRGIPASEASSVGDAPAQDPGSGANPDSQGANRGAIPGARISEELLLRGYARPSLSEFCPWAASGSGCEQSGHAALAPAGVVAQAVHQVRVGPGQRQPRRSPIPTRVKADVAAGETALHLSEAGSIATLGLVIALVATRLMGVWGEPLSQIVHADELVGATTGES
jgi:hypothetical protein